MNPRHACAARACLCLSVLALQATKGLMSDSNSFSATSALNNGDLAKTTAF